MRPGLKALRLLAWASLAVAAAVSAAVQAPVIEAFTSPVTVRLRGLSAVSDRIAWASGPEGTVLRTTDAGKSWSVFKVHGAEKLDFRDVEGFSADEAVVLSIGPGEDSRVYRTRDGGKTWTLSFRNRDPRAFFDCFDFDRERGWMLGDPVDGRFQVLETSDRGASWRLQADAPEAMPGEAAFAASGTCIARVGNAVVFGTGGAKSRLHSRQDGAAQWSAITSGIGSGTESSGVFSIASMNAQGRFLAVGGDFKAEGVPVAGRNIRITPEGLAAEGAGQTRGYRSGVACAPSGYCLATGPSGTDAFTGRTWQAVAGAGYDTVSFAGNSFWFSGDGGRLGRMVIP